MISNNNLKNIIITTIKENIKISTDKVIKIANEIIEKTKTVEKLEQSEFENNLEFYDPEILDEIVNNYDD